MRRALTPLLVLALCARWAAPARAADSAHDAPAGAAAPATLAWRVMPANMAADQPPSALDGVDTLAKIAALRSGLDAEPDSRAKKEFLAALDALATGAARAPDGERQSWIDSHLGELNASARGLEYSTPETTAMKVARAASWLNNRAERWEEGREFADKALSYDPEDRDALIGRSQASSALGDHARAWADADRVARSAPDAAAGWTARAAASYGMGQYLQATEDARRALALDPQDKVAAMLMRLAEGRTRPSPRYEQDKAASRLADSVEREYHGMVQQLNQAQERLQVPPQRPAAKAVERLVATAGERLSVKDYWGAITAADKALALDADDASALYYRSAAHNLLGQYADAGNDATRGLTIAPSDAALRDARSWAYNRMGRFADAISDANHSLEINPKNAYAFANRAFAHEQRGDYEAMAADLKAASKINAQFEPVYRDSSRRHGLAAEGLEPEKTAPSSPSRARSFLTVLAFSLVGGLLIGLGLMHVGNGLRERAAPPRPTGLEADYEIGPALGQGGMGIVYEAFDRKLKRPVAIKMLRDEFALDDAAKAGFVEEARTVAELYHPSIVEIHSVVEDARGLYLVFERLEGRTLDQVLAEVGRLRMAEIKRVLGAVCEALEYAHSRDVVHRDLKPSNVMLTRAGGVKVMDFGISRHAARAGKAAITQTVVGTPHYMAPEQEYGFVRRENDVFSLGAVLYEMVTGARPYDGASPAKLAKSYARASTRLHGLWPEVDALIEHALEPDPDRRIPSPAEFRRRLDEIPDSAVPA